MSKIIQFAFRYLTAREVLLRTFAIFILLPITAANAQNVPIVSGGLSFLSSTNRGSTDFQPVITPVVVAPLGKHLLVESRFDFRELLSAEQQNRPV